MVMNETKSIRFDNLDKLSKILNCSIGDLFEIKDDTHLHLEVRANGTTVNPQHYIY